MEATSDNSEPVELETLNEVSEIYVESEIPANNGVELQPTGQAEVKDIKLEVVASPSLNNPTPLSVQKLNLVPVNTSLSGGKTNTASQQVTSRVDLSQSAILPIAAIKVRNVVAKIQNITTEVICNKVIVQGIVHEQVFFVGTDQLVHHLADDIHFSTFLDIPGAMPGMNVQVHPIIEKVIAELAPDGLSILKKIIIQIFIKVTESVQLNLLPGNGPILFLKEVVGENSAQTLIEADLTLNTAAIKIDEITGVIRDITVDIIPDKVIIQGILHKQIFFVDTANLERHQAEDLHFSLFVDIPGVLPGMDAQVTPRIEAIFFNLISPTTLRQKAVLEFFVKVTENILQPVTIGSGPLFKVEEFIAENTVQELSDTIITLFRPAIKIREIVAQLKNLVTHIVKDKVIVQGILHKQIFFIGTDNIEYHQAEDIPIALFLDLFGANPDDNVHLDAKIEAIFFELLSSTELRQKVIIAVTATVTREVQLNLVIGTGVLFKVEQVIGENVKQILVVRREQIPIPPVPIVSEVTVVTPGGQVFGQQQIILNNTFPLPETAIKIKEIQAIIRDLTARVVTDGVIVEGVVVKTIVFVDTDNIVRSITEEVPFSILVKVPGIPLGQVVEVNVEIENITFKLDPTGTSVNQLIVLKATVEGPEPPTETFTVITDVSGPGITQTKVLVRGVGLNAGGCGLPTVRGRHRCLRTGDS